MRCFRYVVLAVALLLSWAAVAVEPAHDYPIRPASFTAVQLSDTFWRPRLETNRTVTVWYDFQRCEETGRIDNFAKAAGQMPGHFRGIPFDDSDVYKVIEGAAYSLALVPDAKLQQYLDALIAKIAAAQEPDGYLYTARRLIPPEKMPGMSGSTRWSRLEGSHELYNVGHLYEAAVAHWQATGKHSLLDVATKNADLLCKTFGPAAGRLKEPPGHEEVEIGLAKLYRATGHQRYLDLAKFYIELRGRAGTHRLRGDSQQDHKPIGQQDEAVGHAVRAGYFYSGAADVAALSGDAALVAAVDRLWQNAVGKKLYLTGGIGARASGEAFGDNYELPNATAYNETCAAIANALWNQRMFLLHGDAKYLDVLERTIYNGFLSGVALSGREFFYPNPLASGAGYRRSPWFGCACCPVNVVRFLPELPGYFYASKPGALYVNLFAGGRARLSVDGMAVDVQQETRYPWDGNVKLRVDPARPAAFTLHVRIPGWVRNEPVPSDLYRYADGLTPTVRLSVNGAPADLTLKNGFAQLARTWQAGDTVELNLPMPVRRVVAHHAVQADRDMFAVERGPLVYCAEGADNDGKVLAKVPGPHVHFETQERPDLLGGIVTVKIVPEGHGDALTAIPYCLWENRGPNEMTVWYRTQPAPWAASHCNPPDSIAACFDGRVPNSSADHTIPRMTWWDHKGTAEWVERRFERATTISKAAIYWFDDTGHGGCRVPQSWRLCYKSGGEWKPVSPAGPYSTERDRFNRVTFAPVTTTALRLEVQLQPNFSGGILEWQLPAEHRKP
jgi:uncharacterized protein